MKVRAKQKRRLVLLGVLMMPAYLFMHSRGNEKAHLSASPLLRQNSTLAAANPIVDSAASNTLGETSKQTTWPGVPQHELGHPLVQKGECFVQDARSLLVNQYWEEFLRLYENRPDKVNLCGIRINHAYALFLAIKVLQPTTIVESGVNAGQSTYFMRAAAMEHTTIYALDPMEKPLCQQPTRWIDSNKNTIYYTGDKFQDISTIDWASKIKDKSIDPDKTLFFLDDHLVVLDRLGVLMKHGLRHVLLEDNYKEREGGTAADRRGFTAKQLFLHKNNDNSKFLWNNVQLYAEFPPLFPPIMAKEFTLEPRKKAGGFLYSTDTNHDIVEPLFRPDIVDNVEDQKRYQEVCARLDIDPQLRDKESYMQIMNYNQFTYMELIPMAPRLRETLWS